MIATGKNANLEPVLEKVGRVLSEEYGIRVQCRGNRCCTDGRTVYLPSLPDELPDELFQAIRGYLDHEVGHVAAKSDFCVGAEFKAKHGAEGFGLLNCLEDLRIEAYMAGKYPGSAVNLSNAYRYATKSASEKHGIGETLPVMRQLAFAIHARGNGLPDPPFVDGPVRAAANAIRDEIQESVTAPNTRVVAQLAESAWKHVEPLLRVPPASGQPGGASQNGGTDSSDTAPGDDSPAAPAFKRQRKNKQNAPSAPANASPPEEMSPGQASITPSNTGNRTGEDMDLMGGLAQDISAFVARYATATSRYRVWSTEQDTVSVPDSISTVSHAERMAPLMRHVSGVRQKLIQSLLAEARVRWLPDQPEGRINPRALHRLAAAGWLARRDRDAARETANALTRNIFRKRVVAQRLKTAVTLLIDTSHSMNGRKMDLAKAAALVLCESLDRIGIPVSVIAFSTQPMGKTLRAAAEETGIPAGQLEKEFRFAPLLHEVFKQFHEPFRKISGRFDNLRTHMLTPLGESVLFAARQLAPRPEPREVLLILTDGRPTVGLDNDAATFRHARDSIVRVEKAGIETILVGILEPCVRDLHHRSVVVERLEDLPGTVMSQLWQLLTRKNTIAIPAA